MIRPLILGRGNSGQAVAKSLALLSVLEPELDLAPAQWIPRGHALRPAPDGKSLLVLANPHGLHAQSLREGAAAGFPYIVLEKPPCVLASEIAPLREIGTPVALCHGYRRMWGVREMKKIVDSGELGDLVCLEGRYWQSSAAARAGARGDSWKNDRALNGPHDVLVDLGAHWTDLAFHLMGGSSTGGHAWLSYANAESPHRDTHVHLTLEFSGGRRAFASLSKTFHGAGNELEVHVLGTRKSVSWRFQRPDELEIGEGGGRRVLPRETKELGARLPPFHGAGWIEGYTEILRQACRQLAGLPAEPVPTLKEGLAVMETLLGLGV